MLEINKEHQESDYVLQFKGELTIKELGPVMDELRQHCTLFDDKKQLICDLTELEDIDTAGAQVLMSLRKTAEDRGLKHALRPGSEYIETKIACLNMT